jgi:hypothetical protein
MRPWGARVSDRRGIAPSLRAAIGGQRQALRSLLEVRRCRRDPGAHGTGRTAISICDCIVLLAVEPIFPGHGDRHSRGRGTSVSPRYIRPMPERQPSHMTPNRVFSPNKSVRVCTCFSMAVCRAQAYIGCNVGWLVIERDSAVGAG